MILPQFIKYYFSLLILFSNIQSVYSQSKAIDTEDKIRETYLSEGMSMKVKIDALVFMHYQVIEKSNKPKCVLFYFSENGSYEVKSSHAWELDNSSKIVLNLVGRHLSCKLEIEQKFKELDIVWIKEQLLTYSNEDQVNFLYYNEDDNIGYLRTYQVFKVK